MKMSELLDTSTVRVLGAATSKKRLFRTLGEIAQAAHGVPEGAVVDALQDRESLGPTGVGNGVALPHARLDGIDRVMGIFVKLDRALDYGAVDKSPVDLVFALLAPRDAGVAHLKALAFVSRTLRNPGVCEKLRANGDPAKVIAILSSDDLTRAA